MLEWGEFERPEFAFVGKVAEFSDAQRLRHADLPLHFVACARETDNEIGWGEIKDDGDQFGIEDLVQDVPGRVQDGFRLGQRADLEGGLDYFAEAAVAANKELVQIIAGYVLHH